MTASRSRSIFIKGLAASFVAVSLPLTSTGCAYANGDRANAHLNNLNVRDNLRALRHEARQLRQENRADRLEARQARAATMDLNRFSPGTVQTTTQVSTDSVSTLIERGNTAILFPGQVSTFNTRRPAGSTYINDAGNTRRLTRGVSFDFSSTNANITVGENLLNDSTTIDIGGVSKTITSGSRVTAAEYAALNQKLATGSQGLTLSRDGAAEGGSINLNLISDDGSTIRASQLVIPKNVTVTGDFARTADGVRVTKDVVNYGSLIATSSNAKNNLAIIGARDINNEAGASIASQSSDTNPALNLSVRADRDLNNDGSITSAGNLDISAGRYVNNHGLLSATTGDVTFSTPSVGAFLINNTGGTVSAKDGAINVRAAGYNGNADTNVYGGNFYSKELNLNAGQATANLTANEVTGVVNSTGLAAHVNTNTSSLTLGTQCLTGDPTYYNTGDIVIGGNIFVGEDLAIIAGGDITTTQPSFIINSSDGTGLAHNINIIAGANITSTATQVTNPLPAQSIGNFSGNANGSVTINGASASGGNVDFTGATSPIFIDAISSGSKDGANITIAAFAAASGLKGSVLLRSDSAIDAFSTGTGNNGNITIIAGNKTGSAITLGKIDTNNGSGTAANTGLVTISNTQPISSDGNSITFDVNGSITTGNSLVPSNTPGAGSVTVGTIESAGVRITGGGAVTLSTVDTKSFVATAKGAVSLGGSISTKGGELVLVTAGSITNSTNVLLVTGTSGIPAGNMTLISGANFSENASKISIIGSSNITSNLDLGISAVSTVANNAAGGDCTIVAFADSNGLGGHVSLGSSGVVTFGGSAFANGDLAIVGGALSGNAISIGDTGSFSVRTSGGLNGTGSVQLAACTPLTNIDVSTSDGSASSTFVSNILTSGNIQIAGNIQTDADISVRTNGNLQVKNVSSNFMNVGTAGDITLRSGPAANFAAGQINAQGFGGGNGGDVSIDAGSGTYSLNSIFTDTSSTGNAGNVVVNANSSTILAQPLLIVTSSTGGDAGDIVLRNLGTGGIDLSSIGFSNSTGANAGNVVIDATSGPINKTGNLGISANGAASNRSDGLIQLIGSTINITGNLTLAANANTFGSGFVQILTTSGITVPGTVQIAASGSVMLDLANNTFKSGAVTAGSFLITAKNALSIFGQLDTTPAGVGGAGGAITLSAGSGNTTGGITVTAIKADGNSNGTGGTVQLTAGSDGIAVSSGISSASTGTKGNVTLTAPNGPITVGGVVGNNLQVDFSGATPHNATMGNSAVNILKVAGNGAFSLNNGVNGLTIGANISGPLDLTLSTSDSGVGIANANSITVTGIVTLNTPKLTNTGTISAASVAIQSTGNLDIVGGAGGTITGTAPPAGPPGTASIPAAIQISTGSGNSLNLFGKMTFNGDVFINNADGTTTSKANSTFTGNNNIQLITTTYTQETNGQLIGNKLIFLGTSFINSDGAVTLTSDAIFSGRELVIAAKGNVNLGNFIIDTSSSTGDGGNVTIIAGFDMTPSSGGQQQTQNPFTVTAPSVGGGSITITGLGSVNTSSSSANGDAGNITAVSKGGSITLGNLTATSVNGKGGDVQLIGSGITVGDIDTRGATGDGSAALNSSNATNLGPITLQAGLVTGSVFAATGANPGAISTGNINVRNSSILLDAASSKTVTVGGTLTANAVTIFADTLNLTTTDTISVLPSTSGDGGSINIDANNPVGVSGTTFKLKAIGTGAGDGGSISFSTKSAIVVDDAGDVSFDASGPGGGGEVEVKSEGNITIDTNGIIAAGTTGDGAQISFQAGTNTGLGTLTLLDTSFLNAANAIVSGNGGRITLSGQFVTIPGNTSSNPLALSANGADTGDGGSIEFSAFGTDVAVFIGSPTKVPKSGIFLSSLSAKGGLNGGDGGTLSVTAGGNLTVVDTALLTAAPQATGDFNGAQISLLAGEGGGKTGSLVVTGNLNADASGAGTGGQILLQSNNKKAFVIDSIKAQKNGIQGTLSASGAGGLITVTNKGGGITVAGNGATNSEVVSLQAGGKGAIATGTGITITSNKELDLSSDFGAIGKKSMAVDAQFLRLISNNSSINVFDANTGVVTLLSAHAGGSFSLTSAKSLSVTTDFSTDKGAIALTVNSGLLSIGANHITANNGSLTLASLDVTNPLGGISISGNATIETQQKGGQVVIAIGTPPKKGTGATSLAGFNVTATPKNNAFFGTDTSGIISGGTVNVNATNKNVIFNNLSTSGGTISIGNGTQITADPPTRVTSVSNTPINFAHTEQASVSAVIPDLTPSVLIDASVITTNNANLLTANGSTINDTTQWRTATQEGFGVIKPGDLSAGVNGSGYATNTRDLIVDAGFVSSDKKKSLPLTLMLT